jgi:integrase
MARLANGIQKKPNGSYEKQFSIGGRRYSCCAKSLKELAVKEQEKRNAIEAGTYTANRDLTLDKYFTEWIDRKQKQVKPNTIRNYTLTYQLYISPALGIHKIRNIEKREIEKLTNDIADRLTPQTSNFMLTVLKMILGDAVRDDVVAKNVAKDVKSIRVETKVKEDGTHRALTVAEQKAFLNTMKDTFYYEAVTLLLLSGMRIGEVGALEWQDVDFEQRKIHITKTVTKTVDGKTIIGTTPKSDAGFRDIPITDEIADILKSQKKKMFMMDVVQFNSRAFPTVTGGILTAHTINKEIDKALTHMGDIPRFTCHAFRHTFASMAIESGMKPKTLQMILGHSDIKMTLGLYTHISDSAKQEEMDSINWNII